MTRIYSATDDELMIASGDNGLWTVGTRLTGLSPRCLAIHPLRSECVYCGAAGHTPWCSADAGASWGAARAASAERALPLTVRVVPPGGVLDDAARLFAEPGATATLNDVARGAGVSVVYRTFPDEEAMLDVIFDDKIDSVASRRRPSVIRNGTTFTRPALVRRHRNGTQSRQLTTPS